MFWTCLRVDLLFIFCFFVSFGFVSAPGCFVTPARQVFRVTHRLGHCFFALVVQKLKNVVSVTIASGHPWQTLYRIHTLRYDWTLKQHYSNYVFVCHLYAINLLEQSSVWPAGRLSCLLDSQLGYKSNSAVLESSTSVNEQKKLILF